MGLRCLLGHEYANREVEREREERGDEVVVTYRTVETCERCGERRIVSENKEVRPVRGPGTDGVATGLGGGSVTPDPAESERGSADDPGEAGAETSDGDGSTPTAPPVDSADDGEQPATATGGGVEAEAEADADRGDAPEPEPETPDAPGNGDGAIIIDGDGDSDEWPGGGDEGIDRQSAPDDGDGWPETDGEDHGFDAGPVDDDPADSHLDAEPTPEGDIGGASPAASGSTTNKKQFVAAERIDPVRGDDGPGETEFFCPNCGSTRAVGGSSMRAGDICPDCHQGYIAERPQ